ncbi:MAG: UDP-N-acetylenolpyruvoylglucosamine reductase, partial [Gammaproteobacteria bacterium]|nr:UDP-N-acetylenolpyruvoylglucosamine reductase [Gammaproteobacteria bacterium]
MNVAVKESSRGRLMFDEPMSKHTSWRLGGPADRYYVPQDLQDLQAFLGE